MSALRVDTDPAELGFAADRLARIAPFFARYTDEDRLPGWLVAVYRHGKLAYTAHAGRRDVEAGAPVTDDTLWRIFSMTKPVVSVAAMMLSERGLFDLADPISRWLPEFAEPRVFVRGSAVRAVTEPATEPIRVRHLLTHTAGLTYGFHHTHPTDAMYRAAGYEWGAPEGTDLAGACAAWAGLPLAFQPGTEWLYSVASDVLGRLVEVVSGQPLDAFLAEHIFGPLGMADTGFAVPESQLDRLAALYVPRPGGGLVRNDTLGALGRAPARFLSGGGGLVSSAADYARFTDLLRRGGELDGVRLLGSRTVARMRRNHLPGGADLEAVGRPLFAEVSFPGTGFGLGFAVLADPVRAGSPAAAGEYSWGGAASTAFWIDPAEDIVGLFFTQLLPSSTYPVRSQLRTLVYQALVD